MHSLLESYLAEVSHRLGSLPVKRRNDELREMRQHLQNAMTVNRESGQTEDEAAANALIQFGTAEEASTNVLWAWRQGKWKKTRQGLLRSIPIWTAFYISQALQAPRHINLCFYGWIFMMSMFALAIGLPYLPPKSQPAWLPYRWFVKAKSD